MQYVDQDLEAEIRDSIRSADELKTYYEAQHAKVQGRNAETLWFRALVRIAGIATGLIITATISIGVVLFFGFSEKFRDAQISEDASRRAALAAQTSAYEAVQEAQIARDQSREILFEIETEREVLRNLRRQISESERLIGDKNDQIDALRAQIDYFKNRSPKTAAFGLSFYIPEHKYGFALATAMTDQNIEDFSPPAAPQTCILLFADGTLAYRIRTRRFIEDETVFRTEFASGRWVFEKGRYRIFLKSQDNYGGDEIVELYVSEEQLRSFSNKFEIEDENPQMCFIGISLSEKSKLFPTDRSICVRKNI